MKRLKFITEYFLQNYINYLFPTSFNFYFHCKSLARSGILFSKNVSKIDLLIYILKLEPILYRFRTVFHWNSSETKKYPLTYGLTASASPWNPCGTYNTHTRCLRGLSRKNSDNKRKITHALERLLHRGPCHVYVCASTVTFPRRLLYRGAFSDVVHLAAIKMRDAGRNGIDINRFACGTTRVDTAEVSSVNYNK